MRVLFLPSWYPSPSDPLAGSFIHELAHDLQGKNLQIDVVATHQHYKHLQKSSYSVTLEGVIEHHFDGFALPKFNLWSQDKWVQDAYKNIVDKIDPQAYDVIHAHGYIAAFLAIKFLRKNKFVISLHHSDIMMNTIPEWRRSALKEVFDRADHIISPSKAMQEAVEKTYSKKSSVVPNYIDRKFTKVRDNLPVSPRNFISIGALDNIKNHENSIEYFTDYDGTLDIYGEGPNRNNLERLIKRKNLEGKITLKGCLSHPEMLLAISQYDAMISSSQFETFGLSLLEALAAGIPVICKNKYGPLDFIKDTNGIFIEKTNPLVQLNEKYSIYNSRVISQEAFSKFGKEVILPKYINLYNS